MKRLTLAAFSLSAFSALLVAGAIAPSAQALPKADSGFKLQTLRLREFDARNKNDSDFKLQTLRLREFDARNKAEETQQTDGYSESSYQAWPPETTRETTRETTQETIQETAVEQDSLEADESTGWNSSEPSESLAETSAEETSITKRRQQLLDRS